MSERWEPETIPMRENVVEIRDESGRRVCAVPADYPLSGHSWNRRIAIIAAAPEMLELIQQVADLQDPRNYGAAYNDLVMEQDRLADAAQALLAKIEGGEE